MLYLMRKLEESIIINNNVEVKIVEIKRNSVRLGVNFPKSTSVLRKEVHESMVRENMQALASFDEDVEQRRGYMSFRSQLDIKGKKYSYYSLKKAAEELDFDLMRMPNPLKIILENLLRFGCEEADIKALANLEASNNKEIAYRPARVLMQDFTGVPAIVDLAAMRDAAKNQGGDPKKINPLIPVDLVVDHSVQVDKYASPDSFRTNVQYEMQRNKERYEFLRWGQEAFDNFRVVPPGAGICHQVNLEYLAKIVWTKEENGELFAYPDTLVGTDSHTTMVNALSVLGWGVGGIEAEAAMLGQPISMLIPEVVGVKFTGELPKTATATDLVLTVTEKLRAKGVVGKFVEFYGDGLNHLTLADRATISNMSPEYGATCGFFSIDDETIKYLKLTGRTHEEIELAEKYTKEQGLWRDDSNAIIFSENVEIDLSKVQPSLAGPRRPQDRVGLSNVPQNFEKEITGLNKNPKNIGKKFDVPGQDYQLENGSVTIAAITSCTNTSNPYVMIGAGLLARNLLQRGINVKPWVKTSLAPGSKVVSDYLIKSGLQDDLDKLGFNLVGYGCTTCIGNSGPLLQEIEEVIQKNNLVVASVLSGNRNFEGRIHPLVRANYLASPILCVAYAVAGSINIDLANEPLGQDESGKDVYLKDVLPKSSEIFGIINLTISPEMFIEKYADLFEGEEEWKNYEIAGSVNYPWNSASIYVKHPPYFDGQNHSLEDVRNAKILGVFGDSITTDHISPAGSIPGNTPAAKYLLSKGLEPIEFNSYGSRRGNHEIMMRGTFANPRIKNRLAGDMEGGYTKHNGNDKIISVYDAAMKYKDEGVELIIFGGKEYGSGSSRDWAAKGTRLLGVRAVVAESFERIHRSNLVGMGVLPFVFKNNSVNDFEFNGSETVSIIGMESIVPKKEMVCTISDGDEIKHEIPVICRVDTDIELEYLKKGGILQYVLENLLQTA